MSYISTNIQGGLGNQLFQIANLLIYYNKINEKKEIIFEYNKWVLESFPEIGLSLFFERQM